MSEFESSVELAVELDSRSLADARDEIEAELGGIEVAVDADADASGGGGGGGAREKRRRRREFRWNRENNEYLETIADNSEDFGGGGGGGGIIGDVGGGVGKVAGGLGKSIGFAGAGVGAAGLGLGIGVREASRGLGDLASEIRPAVTAGLETGFNNLGDIGTTAVEQPGEVADAVAEGFAGIGPDTLTFDPEFTPVFDPTIGDDAFQFTPTFGPDNFDFRPTIGDDAIRIAPGDFASPEVNVGEVAVNPRFDPRFEVDISPSLQVQTDIDFSPSFRIGSIELSDLGSRTIDDISRELDDLRSEVDGLQGNIRRAVEDELQGVV